MHWYVCMLCITYAFSVLLCLDCKVMQVIDRSCAIVISCSQISAEELSKSLQRFCQEVADGMGYLSAIGVIHHALSARYILLDDNKSCKVRMCVCLNAPVHLLYTHTHTHTHVHTHMHTRTLTQCTCILY